VFLRSVHILVATLGIFAAALTAQQLPPVEAPQAMPGSAGDSSMLSITTDEVLVPTLVEKSGGEVIYGLKAQDFILEDNGKPQKIRVQEEMDTAPVALVVAVEEGGVSQLEFDKVAKLGPLLEMFLSDGRSKAALIGFDSQPRLIQDFTNSQDKMTSALKAMEPGAGGAAILDTASYAVDLLNEQPKEFRRVLLLISEERDHGSQHTKTEELIRKIGRTDVLVLSVSFSPMMAELIHDVKDDGGNRMINAGNIFETIATLVSLFKKNISKEIARTSGGEYATFIGDKGFEERIMRVAKETRNRYLITFSPTDKTPGLHQIKVRTADDYGAKIVARAHYWMNSPE